MSCLVMSRLAPCFFLQGWVPLLPVQGQRADRQPRWPWRRIRLQEIRLQEIRLQEIRL